MDETTPHLHFGAVPITPDNRLNTEKIINRTSLRRMQAELPKILQGAGFDIQRGVENSKAKHLSVPEYKEMQEEKKKKSLEKKLIADHQAQLGKLQAMRQQLDKMKDKNTIDAILLQTKIKTMESKIASSSMIHQPGPLPEQSQKL